MPVLPSGLTLALTTFHIMKPDRNWFRAPEGHFWHTKVAIDETPPPFSPDSPVMEDYVTSPLPFTIDDLRPFVRVGIGLPDGMMYWRGETLEDFPKYSQLSPEDEQAWQAWLASDGALAFLARTIAKCATQAEANKDAIGYPVMRVVNETSGPDGDPRYMTAEKVVDNPFKGAH